ncbi:MAG: hypothetical protein GVY19_07015 [Bacteroidetes bacterium]|jgi:signal transduction histidine kinase/ligand-binding sensor domain-containing protein|nr:hypothetical protein [Bacteroidota bacterium]
MKHDQAFRNWYYLLFVVTFVIQITSCAQNQDKDLSASKETKEKNYTHPLIYTPGTDTVALPMVISLKTCPKPRYVDIPEKPGGFYTVHHAEGNEEKIDLKPPETISLPIVTTPLPLNSDKVEIDQSAAGTGFFSTYTSDDGLALDAIVCGLKDQSGNLWFGTYGGGVSRYDGKSFTNFTTAQGLANNNVRSIMQDKSGNLWFGTYGGGVSRYDGKYFLNFTTAQGLANNIVLSITEDQNGNLWFGTHGGGVSRYDGKSFTTYTTSQGLANNQVRSITEDQNGNLWFGTFGGGASRYDGNTFTNFTTSQGLANNHVVSITEDQNGNLWFGTHGGGVSRYDGKSFMNFTTAQGLANNYVLSTGKDQNGNLWFGTSGGGVTRFDGKVFTNFTTSQGLANNNVRSITEDQSGNLWFGTFGGGVSCYGGKSFINFTTSQGLANNIVVSIAEDQNGNLWFGTFGGGVSRYNGYSFTNFTISQGLANNRVLAITEDQSGNLWFGTSGGGVSRFDGKSFTNFTTLQGLADNKIRSITEDQNGNIWFGTSGGGVSRFDGKSFTNYTTSQGLASNHIWSITEDQNGNLWFGTYGGDVSRYDGKSFTNFTTAQGLANKIVLSITEDQNGNLWFGTYGGGVSRYDGESFVNFTTQDGLVDNHVTQILIYQDKIFIGSNLGLSTLLYFKPKSAQSNNKSHIMPQNDMPNSELNKYTPVFETYNSATGYPVKDVNSNGLHLDNKGIIWAATGSDKTSLVRLDYDAILKNESPPKVILQNLKVNNQNICWYNLAGRSKPKVLSSGSHDSINLGFDSLSLQFESSKADSLAIINEENITFGKPLNEALRDTMRQKFGDIKFGGITRFYPLPKDLILPYKHNHVTFEFAAVAPARPFLVKYQYMLEGYDNGWSPVTNKSSASYGNIDQGTYTFKLKACSPDGIWSEPVVYTFSVLPPWWRSWWMYSIYAIVFIGTIYLLYRWRVTKLKKEKETLELTVKERTIEVVKQKAEIEHKNEVLYAREEELQAANKELRAKNKELIDKNEIINLKNAELKDSQEKLQKLNTDKDHFIQMLAHDLRSPFNMILGFLNLLTMNIHKYDIGTIEKQIILINSTAKNTFGLLEDILTWVRANSGKIAFEPQKLNFSTICNELIERLKLTAGTKEIKINYSSAQEIHFFADKNMIMTILRNLISNSIKFTHKNGRIDVYAEQNPSNITITVSDNGIGIEPEILNKLFDISQKITTDGTANEKGTGLGLLLCKEFVERHNGKIWVESEIGNGSAFSFTIPGKPENE